MTTKAKIGAILIVAVLLIGVYYSIEEDTNSKSGEIQAVEEQMDQSTTEATQNTEFDLDELIAADDADQLLVEPDIPPHIKAEYEAWKTERGFTNEYNMYFNQREYLEQLAANGDPLAAQMLGYMTLGTEQGDKYLSDAAIRGSIRALHFLSSSAELVADGRHKDQQTQDSPMDQHEHSVRALEYLLVAELRGDTFTASNTIAQLRRRQSYTSQDIAQACAQAKSKYSELEQERLALGLPPFDNSPMPIVPTNTTYDEICTEQ